MRNAVEMVACRIIYIPRFMNIGSCVHALLRFCFSTLSDCNVGVTDRRNLWSAPLRLAHVAWFTLQRFIKIGRAVQEWLRFCFSSLKSSNVGNADGRDLLCTPLNMYNVSGRHVKIFNYHYSFYNSNLKHCNVSFTDWRDLRSIPMRWFHTAWYTYKVSLRLVRCVQAILWY
jgi:hypothetical protein